MGNTPSFLDNIVLGVMSGWTPGDSEGWKSLKSVSARLQTDLFSIVTFAFASRAGEGAVRALLDVKHIASNQFYDLAGLGYIRYMDLTYV